MTAQPKSLMGYATPDMFVEPPAHWVRRLREISPVTEKMEYLRFRWRSPSAHWLNPTEGQWELYACRPAAMTETGRAEQFRLHWSELPVTQQQGRKACVTTFQHYLWHTERVDARRYWVLQGPWGGTAASYTPRERRYLDAAGAVSEAMPLGFLPACPFDERAVTAILRRDRWVQAGRNFDRLQQMDTIGALRQEDADAELAYRNQFLKTMDDLTASSAEFLKSYLRKSESDMTMRRATVHEHNALADWRDNFRETGTIVGAGLSGVRKFQIAVGA